jgi:hypothetical protein
MAVEMTMADELGEWDAGDDPGPIPPRESEPRYRLAKRLTIKARDLDGPLQPNASNRVKNRGERLGKVIWRGKQWAATKHGVECRDGLYTIDRSRLSKDWLMHMAAKDWVDLEDFAEALRIARVYELLRGRVKVKRVAL